MRVLMTTDEVYSDLPRRILRGEEIERVEVTDRVPRCKGGRWGFFVACRPMDSSRDGLPADFVDGDFDSAEEARESLGVAALSWARRKAEVLKSQGPPPPVVKKELTPTQRMVLAVLRRECHWSDRRRLILVEEYLMDRLRGMRNWPRYGRASNRRKKLTHLMGRTVKPVRVDEEVKP